MRSVWLYRRTEGITHFFSVGQLVILHRIRLLFGHMAYIKVFQTMVTWRAMTHCPTCTMHSSRHPVQSDACERCTVYCTVYESFISSSMHRPIQEAGAFSRKQTKTCRQPGHAVPSSYSCRCMVQDYTPEMYQYSDVCTVTWLKTSITR